MEVFSQEERNAAFREKRKLLTLWLVFLVLYVAVALTLALVDLHLVEAHANRAHTLWMGVVFGAATIAFFSFTLLFFGVKFRLTRKYCRMLTDMDKGLKDEYEGTFLSFNNALEQKDGVFFYSMLLKTRPTRRSDITERKVLIEHTIEKPPFEEGTRLRFITHANILVSYEILSAPQEQAANSQTHEGEAQ